MKWCITSEEGLPKVNKYYLVQRSKDVDFWEMLYYNTTSETFESDRTDCFSPITNPYAWMEVNCA